MLDHPQIAKNLGVQQGIKDRTFIVQGFGNVGYWASKFFTQEGAKLVGVAEFDGSIYNEDGIDPDQLLEHKKNNGGGIKNYPGCKYFENEDAIYQQAYFFVYLVIFSSQQLWKNQSIKEMPIGSLLS